MGKKNETECAIVSYKYGSIVYGTYNENSDEDIISIFPDDTIGLDGNIMQSKCGNYDITLIKESKFIEKINNCDIDALECIFLPPEFIIGDNKYRSYFNFDLTKLRKSISAICSNSYVKAKKKMIIEEDFDFYKAMKSLFHSIRIFDFGIQIATFGKINDYHSCNNIWEMISKEDSLDWEYYHKKYKPIWNEYHSRFVKVAMKENT